MQHVPLCGEDWISIDGKAISGTVKNASTPHLQFVSLVSIYCSKQKLMIGNQQIIGKKDTEITVVQQLLKTLKLEGVTFTLDALQTSSYGLLCLALFHSPDIFIMPFLYRSIP